MKCSAVSVFMMMCAISGGSAALVAPSFAAGTSSFAACHKAFNEAKTTGTLKGQDYAAFKKAHCTGEAPASSTSATPEEGKKPAAAAPVVSGDVLFPQRIAPEFASLSEGKARMKTCLAQYNANKSTGRNGGLKWIQKGGGYYSACNNRLKGAAQ
ncbi:hypothetical protein [Bombella saccharophila]|uniref:Uncharacterized protein n=1 Tax=Bombella saccharophila TaxID=2967338 RepID=A0ABT3WB24_9PROT|nr:hypothetical protein [Bombella saccharophila]MCX5615002.1 hypothetical protein [Bombella saccharophila]PHI96302.1 hypothetical protein BG621_04925 [Parasaccharibacter apium]